MRLGLHLTLGLLCTALALGLFGFLARGVARDGDVFGLDREVNEALKAHGEQHPEARQAFRIITHFGGATVLLVGGLLVVLVLVTRRHHLLALVWMIAVAGGAALNEVLKVAFQRPRPAFGERVVSAHGYSFPSGHAMGALVFYGLLAYLLAIGMGRRWQRWLVVGVLGLLVLTIGLSRMYLLVHWCSDVLAGYAVATVWLITCVTAIETVRRRRQRF